MTWKNVWSSDNILRYTISSTDPADDIVADLRGRLNRRRIIRQLVIWALVSFLGCITGFGLAMLLEMAK